MNTPTQTERISRIEHRAAKKAAYRLRKGKTKPPFSRTRGTFRAPFDGEVEVFVETLPRGAHRRALPRIEWRIGGQFYDVRGKRLAGDRGLEKLDVQRCAPHRWSSRSGLVVVCEHKRVD